MHWSNKYLGLPWVIAARGPFAYDCWGLVQAVYINEFGINLPTYPGIEFETKLALAKLVEQEVTKAESRWKVEPTPIDGCVVAMSSHKAIHHVGVFIDVDGGLILHTQKGTGVVAQKQSTLKSVFRFSRIEFYSHKWPQ
jgi:cell wall-associated NlpC family hydrolase